VNDVALGHVCIGEMRGSSSEYQHSTIASRVLFVYHRHYVMLATDSVFKYNIPPPTPPQLNLIPSSHVCVKHANVLFCTMKRDILIMIYTFIANKTKIYPLHYYFECSLIKEISDDNYNVSSINL